MKQRNIKISSNRSFGIVFFVAFFLIGAWPILKEGELRYWPIIVSLIFLILGLFKSKLLTPLNKLWYKFGILLGNFIAPIIIYLSLGMHKKRELRLMRHKPLQFSDVFPPKH